MSRIELIRQLLGDSSIVRRCLASTSDLTDFMLVRDLAGEQLAACKFIDAQVGKCVYDGEARDFIEKEALLILKSYDGSLDDDDRRTLGAETLEERRERIADVRRRDVSLLLLHSQAKQSLEDRERLERPFVPPCSPRGR
jgi:hypothetical protein